MRGIIKNDFNFLISFNCCSRRVRCYFYHKRIFYIKTNTIVWGKLFAFFGSGKRMIKNPLKYWWVVGKKGSKTNIGPFALLITCDFSAKTAGHFFKICFLKRPQWSFSCQLQHFWRFLPINMAKFSSVPQILQCCCLIKIQNECFCKICSTIISGSLCWENSAIENWQIALESQD